jgi:hypothetical protein
VACIALGCMLIAGVPPAAADATDRASAHQTVLAWRGLVRDQVRARHAARVQLAAFGRSVSARCAHGFAALAETPPENLTASVVEDVIGEVTLDVFLVAARPTRGPFERFGNRVHDLHWSSAKTGRMLRESVRYLVRALSVQPTDICATARAVTADPTRVPAATRRLAAHAEQLTFDPLPQVVDHLKRLAAPRDRRELDRLLQRSDLGYGESLFRSIARTDKRVKKTLALDSLEALLTADTDAKSDARNAVSWIESCYTDQQDYARCRKPSDFSGLDYGSSRGQVEVTAADRTSYTIVAHSRNGTDFTIAKDHAGTLSRSCTRPGVLECPANGRW